jgi:hypothetical protein
MAHAKRELPGEVTTYQATSPLSPDSGSIGQQAINWAGFEADSNKNSSANFNNMEAEFVVPSVPSNSSYPGYSVGDPMDSFWGGLGGGERPGDPYLAQAGVLTVSQSTASYYFFTLTTYDYNTPDKRGPTIRPGDTAYVNVWYSNGYANYYLENVTSGTYQPFSDTDSNTGIDEDSFECVAEWPGGYGSPYLPKFGSMNYTGCDASYVGNNILNNMGYYNYYQDGDWCTNDAGTTERIQYPGSLSYGYEFTVTWENYCNAP